jgi:alpha-beta hydrolase superfamily lysophospholipase
MFLGLLVGLWTWKCFWIIVMQNKLLYLTWLPPFTRSEVISDYAIECKPVLWEEKQIRSLDGTKLAVCEGRIPRKDMSNRDTLKHQTQEVQSSKKDKYVVICYFQGNGGSTPMRLPLLSQVLRAISETSKSNPNATSGHRETEYIMVALSYRGYWTSSGRATQSGIEMDAQACLNWVSKTYGGPRADLEIILWGHSLGAAVAASAVPKYIHRQYQEQLSPYARNDQPLTPIARMILEAPTSSIKDMLISLYPQKWLPYRYLWPFSWNTWDIKASMKQIARWRDQDGDLKRDKPESQKSKPEAAEIRSRSVPPILLLSAENDEVIPSYVPGQLEKQARSFGLSIQTKSVKGAMHTEAPLKPDGRKALVGFILNGLSDPGETVQKTQTT